MSLHHIQVCCPPGGEPAARTFWVDVVGFRELPQPDTIGASGGAWFVDPDGAELHLGIEDPFRPQAKGHPAFAVDDVGALAGRLTAAGFEVTWAPDGEVPGLRRMHTYDPHGNRLEFLTRD